MFSCPLNVQALAQHDVVQAREIFSCHCQRDNPGNMRASTCDLQSIVWLTPHILGLKGETLSL